ncbi:universal stress protein [Desulfoluna sp.]|uniref:universal stress protein n=1 Tax=Desulfoluna sp. TaxID=2045199 RepID=UPI00262C4FAE|nr:universal stress protein [Desulfoluna sp.]
MNSPKVLWTTDFSRRAEKALPFITSLIREKGADVHILYVIPDIARHEPWYGEYDERHIQRLTRREEQSATKRLHQLCTKYLDGCALFTRHTAVGEPAEEILKLIKAEQIDMVVMADHPSHIPDIGERTLEKVKRMASIPVEVIAT